MTRFDDCVGVNRDYEHFSSYRAAALFHDMDDEALAQQRMMMLNMDPPMHTRYRRLVNKGFTPRMIRDLEANVVTAADSIIDGVCETGSADFVEQISAELPLQVIADLMGVPQEDRHLVFDWSNKMIGSDDPEYQISRRRVRPRRRWSCSPMPTSCAPRSGSTPTRTCSACSPRPRSTATSCPSSSSTSSSCCWRWPATRPPATSSPGPWWPSSTIPTSGSG